MPLIELDTIIKEYYETKKELNPTLTFEQFLSICRSPFRFIRSQIELDAMPTVMIKHIGKFEVSIPKFKQLIKENEKNFFFEHIDKEKYEARKSFYTLRLQEAQRDKERTKYGNNNKVTGEIELIDDTENTETD